METSPHLDQFFCVQNFPSLLASLAIQVLCQFQDHISSCPDQVIFKPTARNAFRIRQVFFFFTNIRVEPKNTLVFDVVIAASNSNALFFLCFLFFFYLPLKPLTLKINILSAYVGGGKRHLSLELLVEQTDGETVAKKTLASSATLLAFVFLTQTQ